MEIPVQYQVVVSRMSNVDLYAKNARFTHHTVGVLLYKNTRVLFCCGCW